MPPETGPLAGRAHVAGLTLARAVALALTLATLAGGMLAAAPAAQTADAPAAAATPPSPTRFVTDGAGFLTAAARDELEQRLERYERDTGRQVILWIGQTTGGEPIESWAVRAFAAWRVGRKGIDDGVAVFIMAADRRVRIEVGYGVEDRLPDALAARIIGDQMIPRLRAGDQDGAARAGVAGVLAALGGEQGAPPLDAVPTQGARPEMSLGQLILLGLVALIVLGFVVTNPQLALLLLTTIASNHGRGGGGQWGGGGGGWGGGGGGGFSGGGGRSGGGGASGSW